jgi:cytosine deaminase
MINLLLRNGTLGGAERIDVAVDRGVIIDRGPGLNYTAHQEVDLEGRLIIPGFVESHLHLDIALMNDWDRPGRARPFKSPVELNQEVEQRRKAFTRQSIEECAGSALELASRHGVTALRAQCHVDTEIGLRHLEALLAVKEKHSPQVSLQIVAFPQQGLLRNPGTLDLFREAFRMGVDVMGCASNLDSGVNFREHIEAALKMAMDMDADLDLHADLGIPQRVELDDLEVVYAARRAMEVGYQRRVTAGHVCALDSALPDIAEQAIELIRQAEMSVISQPDMYRLGREDAHHVRRGLTRVKELLAAGVNVAYASNNVRDGYRPLGNFDLLEEGLILAYGAHMDSVDQLETLLCMSTYNAAQALRLKNYGLEKCCTADLVVLDAPTPSAAIIGQAEKRYVFKAGRLMATSQTMIQLFNGSNLSQTRLP